MNAVMRSARPISTLLLASMLSGSISLALLAPAPAQANATPPVPFDPTALLPIFTPLESSQVDEVPVKDSVVRENTAVTAGSARTEVKQDFFEWFMRFIRSTLKKQLLDMIVSQIINWIQGGGSPKFVTDWQGFLADAANIAAGRFAEEIGLGFLCQPFGLELKLALGIGLPRSSFSQQISCTLDDIVGNVQNFYSNFANGGWDAYQNLLQPQNNFYGAYLMGYTRLTSLNYYGRTAALAEAQAGGGFLSTKECRESSGSSISQDPRDLGDDLDGDGRYGDVERTCRITTPGQTIGRLASKAIESDIDFILSADEIDEYVSAIADALINRLVREGARGLAGLTNANAPQGGSIPPGQSGCSGLPPGAQGACQNYGNPNYQGPPPTRPTGLNADSIATSTIRITWDDNAVNEDYYQVERSTNPQTFFSPVASQLPSNTREYTDAGLVSGTRYYYRVRAVNFAGPSPYSNVADERAR